jgi:ubiquinone/menaquinone biosynthesis C-methylase UbiE
MKRLNFGSAFDIHEGWVNLDKDDHGQDVIADVLEGLPFEDDYFDGVVANHVLHMFTWDELIDALTELARVLRSGGVLRVIDIDPIKAFHAYESGHASVLVIPDEVEPSIDGKFCKYLTWYGTRRNICTADFMCDILRRAGFVRTSVQSYGNTGSTISGIPDLDSRKDESYFVEATK